MCASELGQGTWCRFAPGPFTAYLGIRSRSAGRRKSKGGASDPGPQECSAVLCDLGSACSLPGGQWPSEEVSGSPSHMPPEAGARSRSPSPRAGQRSVLLQPMWPAVFRSQNGLLRRLGVGAWASWWIAIGSLVPPRAAPAASFNAGGALLPRPRRRASAAAARGRREARTIDHDNCLRGLRLPPTFSCFARLSQRWGASVLYCCGFSV